MEDLVDVGEVVHDRARVVDGTAVRRSIGPRRIEAAEPVTVPSGEDRSGEHADGQQQPSPSASAQFSGVNCLPTVAFPVFQRALLQRRGVLSGPLSAAYSQLSVGL